VEVAVHESAVSSAAVPWTRTLMFLTSIDLNVNPPSRRSQSTSFLDNTEPFWTHEHVVVGVQHRQRCRDLPTVAPREYLCVAFEQLPRPSVAFSTLPLHRAVRACSIRQAKRARPDQNPNFPFWFSIAPSGRWPRGHPSVQDLAVLHPKQVIEGSVLPAQRTFADNKYESCPERGPCGRGRI